VFFSVDSLDDFCVLFEIEDFEIEEIIEVIFSSKKIF
jgi:hypothetical protein